MIPRISTIDLQFSVNVGKPKSLVKFGASNFFNDKFAYSFGGPHVGVVFYASYVIDDIFGMQ